jgi:predicted dinucleotide-binding enzyme
MDCLDNRDYVSRQSLFITTYVMNKVATSIQSKKERYMNVTILGAGNMGSAFVKQFSRAGHHVRVTSRSGERAAAVAAANRAVASPPGEALAGSDVVVVATAYPDAVAALKSLGSLEGKVIIDATNPLSADFMSLTIGHDTSAAEEIAKAFPEAAVVKAFNTVFAQVLAEKPSFQFGQTAPVFVASDSERAKLAAKALIQSIGFKAVDAGPLRNARYLEPLAGLNIYLGYGAGHGTEIAPAWIRKAA